MNTSSSTIQTLLLIKKRHEDILRAVAFYRFATARDLARLLFSEKSITHVREYLAVLCGGGDLVPNQHLFRFPMPDTRSGNPERIYTLGAKGRAYLQRLGFDVSWYFRPTRVNYMSYGYLRHPLMLTRSLIAAHTYCRSTKGIRLTAMRIQYELDREPTFVETVGAVKNSGAKQKIKVVPDAWLNFELLNPDGSHSSFLPVLWEIDRGMEYRQKFKQHVRGRLAFIAPEGAYKRLFGTNNVRIAYLTTGSLERLRNMLTWTQEVLSELRKKNYARFFRFCSLSTGSLDPYSIFQGVSWARPFEKELVPLK